ncbi:chromosome condensation complex Condensin, subunit G [Friedmanniomyces endolithicus]|uniref:Chromosome condensation complex Condensin, subunit G n=1 Tax=Friedmanniomyces endolithicus TaxID=329885 RepID=A0AAN6KP85_9PEZI|nr:chromosome condensation complex Condensin, subunit G [Friedmanniomyces endolithicus]KAK0984880.1 chromosome condensation complex Condensin, subunit G [Friedmanniomyces endolithicus]KAK0994549.1 chromosome condensation complex Condensin, subunit G [Friedmanniomyces endolithicus]
MPGRTARGSRAAVTTSPAATTTVSRKRATKAAGRNNSPSADVPDEGADTTLRRAVCIIFSDAQKSTVGHKKLMTSLRKIQEACCYPPVNYKKGKQTEDFDADDFDGEVVRCVLRILPVRKSEPVGDRVVRFLGTYLSVATQKDNEIATLDDPDVTSVSETPTGRLASTILGTLLPLLSSKDKTVRFRATQITSHMVNKLNTLDDSLFHKLRLALLKRMHDKETPVRVQAIYGLGRLAQEVVDDNEDHDESGSDDNVGAGVLTKLLIVLQHDPAAEVRRNLLLNLPLIKEVLPYLLERARDADGSTRRALYASLLPTLGDFRHLSLTHREKLLRWGLRDRDENVRKATARLFRERWIEDCAALPAAQAMEQEEGEEQPETNAMDHAAVPSLDALLELIERIDVINSGGEGGIAQVAMKEFWEGRPDYVDYVSFPDTFWEDLSPELAFVARTFNDYCRSSGREDGYDGPRMLDGMIEDKLPEVTKFGFLLEREFAKLIEMVQLAAAGEDEEAEEDCVQREFVVEQMLHMALTFDYSDEVGRRKMFGLMREALANPELPEETTRLAVEVLRLVCGENLRGEREFCGVVVEVLAEVHDCIMDDDETEEPSSSVDDSFHSATEVIEDEDAPAKKPAKKLTPEDAEREEQKAIRAIVVNMKCLHIALCVLQNVQCGLNDNIHLVSLLNTLVVPAVRSTEAPIRERGLCCLGLCCLLSKTLAEENIELFLHCLAKGHPALQTIALQIIGDVLVTHPSLLADIPPPVDTTTMTTTTTDLPAENPLRKQVQKALSKSLKSPSPTVQSTAATTLAKTMLTSLITSPDLLKQLVLTFFDPDTADNAQLRQSLAYFLPVYCHSRAENAGRMAGIAPSVMGKLAVLREAMMDEAEADEGAGGDGVGVGGVVGLGVVGGMLVEWTDPRKGFGFAAEAAAAAGQSGVGGVGGGWGETHFLLAEAVLERLVTSQVGREERKGLLGMLGMLYLPAGGCEGEKLKGILELVTEARETHVVTDAAGRKVLEKLFDDLIKMVREVAMAERGVGSEETVVETTEMTVLPGAEATEVGTELGEDEDEEVTQMQRTMRDTTIGAPDAEGTRMQVEADSELLSEEDETGV